MYVNSYLVKKNDFIITYKLIVSEIFIALWRLYLLNNLRILFVFQSIKCREKKNFADTSARASQQLNYPLIIRGRDA